MHGDPQRERRHRGRTVLTYGTLGVASLALSLLLGASGGFVLAGPGPLAFDPVLALQVGGALFVLTAVVAALDRMPDWAVREESA